MLRWLFSNQKMDITFFEKLLTVSVFLLSGFLISHFWSHNGTDFSPHMHAITNGFNNPQVILAPPVMQRVLVYTAGFFQKFTITPTAFINVIAIAIAMKYLCARLIMKDFFIRSGLGRYRNNIAAVVLPLALVFVMAIPYSFAFIFQKWSYLGTCATNQWHNPTTIISTPPALLFFYFTFRYFTKPAWKDIIICIFFAILTIYIKPSFIIAFVFAAPLFAAALLLLKIIQQIKSHTFRGKTFAYYFLQIAGVGALLVLLCGAILLDNERRLFSEQKNNKLFATNSTKDYVKIDFKANFYKNYSRNDSAYKKYSCKPILKNIADNKNEFFWRITMPLMFLTGVAYPLLVSFLYISKNKNDNLLLLYSGFFAIIGFLIALAFSEYGQRAADGNFTWQVLICNTVFFMTAIMISIKIYFERLTMFATMPPDIKFSAKVWFYVKKYFDWRLACSLAVLFYHTGFGIHYLVDAFSRNGAMWQI